MRVVGLLLVGLLLIAACSGPDEAGPGEPTETPSLPGVATGTMTTPPPQGETPVPPAPTSQPPEGSPAPPDGPTQPPLEPTLPPQPPATEATQPPDSTSPPPASFNPDGVTVSVENVGSGFTQPAFVTHAGDDSGRIFILEKVGTIKPLDGTMFLDIRDRVIQTGVFGYEHEQGMLGVAFHPLYAENGFLYVHYSDLNGDHVISRFSTGPDGVADPNSESILLTLDQPEVNFHGGQLLFGTDGYLYIGLGTGGSAVELQYNSQDLGSLYGKILRIDVDSGDPYGIPADNPFVDDPDARPEVWAYGLRNPWRFSFDRATNDLYIGGPGQFTEEWVNYQPADTPAGQNFGWPMYEGSQCWDEWEGPCDPTGLVPPILTYPTYDDGNCVVIGGNVYRGPEFPALQGAYFFGDFCSGRVWTGWQDDAGAWQMTEMLRLPGPGLISSFGEDEAGEVYVCDIVNGVIYRFVTG
ncbi:MAG: PQQ-dependent sugar dehydrogenase [Chloroflexia bacterium]|nr:PQQ-dependent sugar dehydrogenase [Chloroflexia bacterium]